MGPPPDVLGQALWAIGSAFCHQIPERSLFLGGYQLPVCARDLGTYLGFFAMSLYYLVGRRYRRVGLPDRPMLILAMMGVGLFLFDGISSYLGLRDTSNTLRLGSGLAFGAGTSMLLLSVTSVQLFHGKAATATFCWRDGLIIYPLLALVGLGLLTLDGAGDVLRHCRNRGDGALRHPVPLGCHAPFCSNPEVGIGDQESRTCVPQCGTGHRLLCDAIRAPLPGFHSVRGLTSAGF